MIALGIVVLLAATVAFVVLAPLFHPGALAAERVSRQLSTEQDLHTRHVMAMAALRDLEDDRQTGKIGDADYAALKGKLEARAIELMKSLDAIAAGRA